MAAANFRDSFSEIRRPGIGRVSEIHQKAFGESATSLRVCAKNAPSPQFWGSLDGLRLPVPPELGAEGAISAFLYTLKQLRGGLPKTYRDGPGIYFMMT